MSYSGIGRAELIDLSLSLIVLIIAFSMVGGKGIPGIEVVLISALGVGTGFILHELAHKFVAQRYGYWAEYRASHGGLVFIILMAMAGFIFAAPGAVMIARESRDSSIGQSIPQIDGAFLDSLRRKENAEQLRIALAGPLTNIVLAALFFGLLLSGILNSQLSMNAAYFAFFINLNLAAFNLIPVGPLDGRKIYQSNPVVWAIVGVPTILVALLVILGIRII